AHTKPSQIAKAAPKIHPSIACGPAMALMISGIVMNGPTPIMSIMFSAVASRKPTSRISSEEGTGAGALLLLMPSAQEIYIKSNGAGHACGKLAEEGVTGINVDSLPKMGAQQTALQRWLAGIV